MPHRWLLALGVVAGCGGGGTTGGSGSAAGATPGTAAPVAASPAVAPGGCAALGTSQFGALMFAMMKRNLPPASPEVARMDAHQAELIASINAAMTTACVRDGWPASAAACVAAATTSAALDPCEQELTADQTAKLGEALSGAMEAMFPPAAAAPLTATAAACDRYIAVVAGLSTCPQVPAQVKDAAQKSVGQIQDAVKMLAQPDMPEASKQGTYDACKQAADKLAAAAASMGCAL